MVEHGGAPPRAAEFFAGMGLVRLALSDVGCEVAFAHDISKTKQVLYEANFGRGDFVCGDIRELHGGHVPIVDIATASFPCTDLSLAGNRAGFSGAQSGTFRELARVLAEMGARKPPAVLLENVVGFATSKGGADLAEAISSMNALGYLCDLLMIDAKWFVPQSRPRLFVAGVLSPADSPVDWAPSRIRPQWILDFAERHPHLHLQAAYLPEPPETNGHLVWFVDRLGDADDQWWGERELEAFLSSLSPVQEARLAAARHANYLNVATAYRRTRHGRAVWEIRSDDIAGCLRTGRGGSSRQALVEAGLGSIRVRWMTAREYARLQGAPSVSLDGVSEAQARFALGDAVCVPAVAWLLRNYPGLLPDWTAVGVAREQVNA